MSRLLDFLRRHEHDHGLMAALRCGLGESREVRAWPVLACFCDLASPLEKDKHACRVAKTVAGLFAAHPAPGGKGDMGALCLALCRDDERAGLRSWRSDNEGERAEGPMAGRLRYLLAAGPEEICPRVTRVALYAKSRDLPVAYEQLEKDLLTWPRARRAWAQHFWGSTEVAEPEAESGPEVKDGAS